MATSIVILQACSNYQECKYMPVVLSGHQQLIENSALISKSHLDSVGKVLDFYKIEYSRPGDLQIVMKGDICSVNELIWNFTTKSEGAAWFKLQGIEQ